MEPTPKTEPDDEKRILNRVLARELSREELAQVTGCGTISLAGPDAHPCDTDQEY